MRYTIGCQNFPRFADSNLLLGSVSVVIDENRIFLFDFGSVEMYWIDWYSLYLSSNVRLAWMGAIVFFIITTGGAYNRAFKI